MWMNEWTQVNNMLKLFLCVSYKSGTSLVAQMVNCLSIMWETWVQSLGWEDSLEKEMVTHSSTLAWKIPWTEEPVKLQSMGLQRVRHDWMTSLSLFRIHGQYLRFNCTYRYWDLIVLIEPGGLPSMGSYRVGHDWNDLLAAAA